MEKNKRANAKASSLSFARFNGLHMWYCQDERSIWIKVYHRIKWERNISCMAMHLRGVALTMDHSDSVLRKGLPKHNEHVEAGLFHTPAGLSSGLGRFFWPAWGWKTNLCLSNQPVCSWSQRQHQALGSQLHSGFTLLLLEHTASKTAFTSCSQGQGQYSESMAMMSILSVNGFWSIYKYFCDVSVPKHFCCQYFLFYENFYSLTTNSLMAYFHTEK